MERGSLAVSRVKHFAQVRMLCFDRLFSTFYILLSSTTVSCATCCVDQCERMAILGGIKCKRAPLNQEVFHCIALYAVMMLLPYLHVVLFAFTLLCT